MTRPWFTIRSRGDIAHVALFDEIGSHLNGSTADDFAKALASTGARKIEMVVDSSGGDARTGLSVAAILRGYETHAVVTCRCWSSALLATLAAQTVKAWRGASFFIHGPVVHVGGMAAELRAQADRLDKLRAEFAALLIQETEQPAAVVAAWLERDTWLDCEQALAAGLIDEIVERPQPLEEICAKRALVTGAELEAPISEGEALFTDFLHAFGKVEVRDRARFIRELNAWAIHNTVEHREEVIA